MWGDLGPGRRQGLRGETSGRPHWDASGVGPMGLQGGLLQGVGDRLPQSWEKESGQEGNEGTQGGPRARSQGELEAR